MSFSRSLRHGGHHQLRELLLSLPQFLMTRPCTFCFTGVVVGARRSLYTDATSRFGRIRLTEIGHTIPGAAENGIVNPEIADNSRA